jgi:glutathione synthase/RimK-type ligase-like ATP-grasp enzyme
MSLPRVAVATCVELPEPDHDEELLLSALRAAGTDTHLVAWDDPDIDWSTFDLVVIRSTWNYIDHLDDFLAWVGRAAAATTLLNPEPVIRWNCHKAYLRDLSARGLPVVPTVFLPAGSEVSLAAVMAEHGWADVVAKPAVGAGSYLTERVRLADLPQAEKFWRPLVSSREAMVQPYLSSVSGYGERALIWVDGEFTHAIRKDPRLGDAEESVSEALPIAADERELAHQVLADSWDHLLYARVDLIRDDAGLPLIAELELVEPSLFLLQSPAALQRLVTAVVRRL